MVFCELFEPINGPIDRCDHVTGLLSIFISSFRWENSMETDRYPKDDFHLLEFRPLCTARPMGTRFVNFVQISPDRSAIEYRLMEVRVGNFRLSMERHTILRRRIVFSSAQQATFHIPNFLYAITLQPCL
jgi:hypothetical protein